MEKKRPDLVELRRQRELIRRIAVGGLVIALAFILFSCQALTSRDAQVLTQASPPRTQAPAPRGGLDLASSRGSAYGPQLLATVNNHRGPRLSYESQAASPTDQRRGGS